VKIDILGSFGKTLHTKSKILLITPISTLESGGDDTTSFGFMLGAKGPGAHGWAFPCRSNDIPAMCVIGVFDWHHHTLTNSRRFMNLGETDFYIR